MLRVLSIYYRRFWPFVWLSLIALSYTLSINVTCIFPESLCSSNDEITKIFSSVLSVLGALIVVINLDESFRQYRNKSLATHYAEELSRSSNITADVSFSISPPHYSLKGGNLDMVHKKNAATLHELRDHIYEEIKRLRKENREELSSLESELSSSIDKTKNDVDTTIKKLTSLRNEVEGIAVGNANRQVFAIMLVLMGATLNVL